MHCIEVYFSKQSLSTRRKSAGNLNDILVTLQIFALIYNFVNLVGGTYPLIIGRFPDNTIFPNDRFKYNYVNYVVKNHA